MDMLSIKKFKKKLFFSALFVFSLLFLSVVQNAQAATVTESGVIQANQNDGIWGEPYHGSDTPYITSASKFDGKRVMIIQESQTSYGTYDQFSINGQTIGWLDKKVFGSINQVLYNKTVDYTGQIVAKDNDGVWSDPYLGDGSSYLTSGKQFSGQEVKIVREAQTEYGIYYQFEANGKIIGWLDKNAFGSISQVVYNKTVDYTGQITAKSNDGIWNNPYLGSLTSYVAQGTQYNGRQVKIIREAQTTYGTYYQFTVNNQVIGWLDKSAFGPISQIIYNNAVNYGGQITAGNNDGIWDQPYLGGGTSYVASGSQYNGRQVKIIREAQTTYGTYYQFSIDGQTVGWLDEKAFRSISDVSYNNEVNYSGKITAGSNDGIWSEPYLGGGTSYVAPASQYNGWQVKVAREAQTTYGTYYQFSIGGKVIGWLDKRALILGDNTYNDQPVYYTGRIIAGDTDGIWTEPYNTPGTKYVASGRSFYGKVVQIIHETQTDHGTYYLFQIDGQTIGWLDKNAFDSVQSMTFTGIDLKIASNITATDIQNYFNARHPDSLLKNYAQDFIDAQNQYGVNAQYLVAHAIWETGWGNSNLATYKHNIYGFGAYDGSPFASAYYFPTIQDCINYVASYIRNNYLNSDGKYYSATYGATLQGMNEHYATDTNWSAGIASVMNSMEALDPVYYTNTPELSSVLKDTNQYGTDIPVGQPTP
ncbi:GW domain-containing glycosaminoglycan-binding protein [Sporolactobacillus kofuensis]|uniref:GW domain-containing glycosaminoglycan-binding protein n=1 Tax=Sporolactobacillus kofuensis TaxID=269672 RepID=A0ABW1WGT4_9BACL|nr:GW domain-containing glycosaminoglycan-binding protein [Sporolactobacillus kofuensis]MCO7177118.1 GW domain-containing glycosaminoglycan-binding protein [Sporolactobacillus kofuensis]